MAKYDEVKRSLFLEMFGDPVGNEMGWEVVRLKDLFDISSGSTPSRNNTEYYGGSIPWIKTGEINYNTIFRTEEYLTELGLKMSACRIYEPGSIIMAMYGQGVTRGKVSIIGAAAATNQACAVFTPNCNEVNVQFMFSLFRQSYDHIRTLSEGGNQSNLSGRILKAHKVPLPPLSLQQSFADRVALIDRQQAGARAAAALGEEVFGGVMGEVFG